MGKSGAGKSTVANHLVGYDPLSDDDPSFGVSDVVLQSVTREVKDEMVEFKRGRILYRVTVIDTVGLFDTRISGQDPIFEKIETYLTDCIEGVNLILFVFKKGRFTAEEKEVFEYVRKKFTMEISPISALAVTNCENDNPQARAKLIQEFYDNVDTNPIANQMKMGILPVGFPPLKSLLPQLQVAYKDTMEQDQEALRDLIIRAEKPHLTSKLFEKVRRDWILCTIL